MNIEMQSCGLLMLLVLLVILLREKSLDLNRRRKFIITMLSCIVCLVMDIASVVGIVLASRGDIPDYVAFATCKLYLVFLINVGYRGFLYSAGEFFDENTHKTLRNVYRLLFYVGVVAIILLPINYHCSGREVYSYGPSPLATYTMAFIMLVSTMVIALVGGRSTSRRRKRVIILWQACWIVSSAVQFMRPELLVVGFAAAFGIVLVYAELENPNEGIDRVTGQFTANALYTYLTDLYVRKVPFSAMHMSIDYGAGDYDLELQTSVMRRIGEFLDAEGGFYVFRESDHDFVTIYKGNDALQEDYNRIVSDLDSVVDLPVKVTYTLIPDSTILNNPDEFMQFQHYNGKYEGSSDCIIAGRELAEEMRDYFRIRDQINWALANDCIEVCYQPIYNVELKKFTTVEALVRIRDNEGRLVMPTKFIPIAEENGLIVPLGTEVFRQVCEMLAKGEIQKLGIESVEVNLSMAQFSEEEPAGFVLDMISRYDIRPEWINLEITETADPATRRIIQKNMETLIDKGVRFALDDFGTGRSNIDYFMLMPVSLIKFDYKFTQWYFESDKARDVMKSIVDIIKGMDLPIVMEGVETEQQLDTMIELGASYIQGFFFSKPVSEEELIEFLKRDLK